MSHRARQMSRHVFDTGLISNQANVEKNVATSTLKANEEATEVGGEQKKGRRAAGRERKAAAAAAAASSSAPE